MSIHPSKGGAAHRPSQGGAARRPGAESVSARFEAEGRKMYGGIGEAWNYLSTIIAGIAVWAGAGYGLDYWLGTKPVLFVIGALVGNCAGIYLVYVKSFREETKTSERGPTAKGAKPDAA